MVGEGVGTCTTMEGKFRFRWDNTGNEVPKEYWDTKNKDLLGGPFNTVRKVDGKWYIFQRVEHDNPADYYNTCEKMGKKRAHVDAILTATAASDIFTQDIEDMPEVINQQTKTETAKNPPKQPQSKSSQQASVKQDAGDNKTAREKLDDELKAYCADNEGLIDMNLYKTVLKEVSKWTDKDGKEHSFDEITEKISDKWIGSALGKLRDRMKVDNA